MLPSAAKRNLITLVSELCYLELDCSSKQRLPREDTVDIKETRFVQQIQVRTRPQEPFQVEDLTKQSREEVRLGLSMPNLALNQV